LRTPIFNVQLHSLCLCGPQASRWTRQAGILWHGSGEKFAAPSVAASAFDFFVEVLATDAKLQAAPVAPGTVATLKPHKLWKSPLAPNTRKGHTRHLYSTELVLKSSLAIDLINFYRKLVAASKPAEIDLIPFSSFDPACALWPNNRCSDMIFEMNDALTLRLDQTGMLKMDDETIKILYQKHILESNSGVRVKLLPLPQPPVRARTDARTNPSAQRATELRSVLARVYSVSIQNQITTTVP
jgi:hypothetical protein